MTEIERKIITQIYEKQPIYTYDIVIEVSKNRFVHYEDLWNEFRSMRERGILIYEKKEIIGDVYGIKANRYTVYVNPKYVKSENLKKRIKK